MRKTLLLVAAALILAAPVMAFHDDGVAHCNGCHTMHNSQNGGSVAFDENGDPIAPFDGNDFLLYYASPTDVCLNCHYGSGSYHVWEEDNLDGAAGYEERGGGDFSYSTAAQINENTHDDFFYPMQGEGSGHTLVSVIGGRLTPDAVLSEAPGDSSALPYPSDQLRCTSCHDPHANGAFRFLYRQGQVTGFGASMRIWTNTLVADGIGMFGPAETNTNHNVYQDNYAEWCGTCHADAHNAGAQIHPTGGVMNANIRAIYDAYTGSDDCVGVPAPCGDGTQDNTNSYLSLVPFEDTTRTLTGDNSGPGTNSLVTCVSCHRAHGTSGPDGGRWDFNVTALEEDGSVSGTYALPNPYGAGQRSLCNKCHAKDEYDNPWS